MALDFTGIYCNSAIVCIFQFNLLLQGSIFIITDIVRSKEKLGRTYSRILLVMSLYDFFTSLAQAMSTWPMPADTPGVVFAKGTTFTCNFQGFFTQLGVGAPMYNCSLSFYYLLVIAFAYSEQQVKQIEWFMHLIPLTVSFSTAIAGIPLTLYNSSGLWCWIGSLPGSCAAAPDSPGNCERGDHAWIYRWGVYYAPVWFCVLTITINMAIVSYLVWAKEKRSLRFRFPGKRANVISLDSKCSDAVDSATFNSMDKNAQAKHNAGKLANMVNRMREKQQRKQERVGLSSQVFWQAFYYVLAFYITWIVPTILRLLQTLDMEVPYYIILLMAILLPLQGELDMCADNICQLKCLPSFLSLLTSLSICHTNTGFFNFLVYVRPRVVQYRRRHPEYSFLGAMMRSINRTVTKLTSSEIQSGGDTDTKDVAVMDPCYALSMENKSAHNKRKSSRSLKKGGKRKSLWGKISGHTRLGGKNFQEQSPGSESESSGGDFLLKLRERDEKNLLEEEDPSFYEGQSSRSFEDMSHVDEDNQAGDESHNEDVYFEEHDGEGVNEKKNENVSFEKEVAKPMLLDRDSTTEEEESGNTNKHEDEYQQLKGCEGYRYPEFNSDPDFYFM